MTDHTPDVADLPAELEQLRVLAGDVARFASERAELWRVRRALETAARAWLDTSVTADREDRRRRLLEVVGDAGDEPTREDRSGGLAEQFVRAVCWSTPPAGRVFRGEAWGVGVVRDPLPTGRDGDTGREDKTKQDTAQQGRVERVLVELRPIGTAGPPQVDPCFTPASNDGGLQTSLEAAVTAALGWVTAHNDWLEVPETDRWQARVYLGGYPLPVDANSEWHNRKVTGPSLGLAVALATVAAFLPDWACRAAPRVVATGMCDPDGTVRPVGGTEIKAARATQLPKRLFVYPEGSGEEFPPQERETLVAQLELAINIAFPLWGRLSPGERVDGWLAVLAGVSGRHGRDLVELLVPPRVKGDPDRLEARLVAGDQWALQLTGVGGAGKTSALTWLYVAAYRGQLASDGWDPVPCYLNAADLEHQTEQQQKLGRGGKLPVEALAQAIAKELFDPLPDDWPEQLKRLAADVGLLVLVDGLNEMVDPQGLIYEGGPLTRLWSVLNHARRGGAPSVVVAAGRPDPHGHRAAGTDALRKAFTPVELAPLTENDAAWLLDKLAVAGDAAERALHTVGGTGGLAGTPMVVALLARLYQTGTPQPPDNIGELYRQVIDVWFTDDLDSRWPRPDPLTDWEVEDLLPRLYGALGRLAVTLLEHRTATNEDLKDALRNEFALADWITDTTTVGAVARWFRNCPLLVWHPDHKQFRFLHDSLADYLAAHHLHTTAAPLDDHLKPGREGLLTFLAALDPQPTGQHIIDQLLQDEHPSAWQYRTAASCATACRREELVDRVHKKLSSELGAVPQAECRERLLWGVTVPIDILWEEWPLEVLRTLGPDRAVSVAQQLVGTAGEVLRKLFAAYHETQRTVAEQTRSLDVEEALETDVVWWDIDGSLKDRLLDLFERYLDIASRLGLEGTDDTLRRLLEVAWIDEDAAIAVANALLDPAWHAGAPSVEQAGKILLTSDPLRSAALNVLSAARYLDDGKLVVGPVGGFRHDQLQRLAGSLVAKFWKGTGWVHQLVERADEERARIRGVTALLRLWQDPQALAGDPKILADALQMAPRAPQPPPDRLLAACAEWLGHHDPAVRLCVVGLLRANDAIAPVDAQRNACGAIEDLVGWLEARERREVFDRYTSGAVDASLTVAEELGCLPEAVTGALRDGDLDLHPQRRRSTGGEVPRPEERPAWSLELERPGADWTSPEVSAAVAESLDEWLARPPPEGQVRDALTVAVLQIFCGRQLQLEVSDVRATVRGLLAGGLDTSPEQWRWGREPREPEEVWAYRLFAAVDAEVRGTLTETVRRGVVEQLEATLPIEHDLVHWVLDEATRLAPSSKCLEHLRRALEASPPREADRDPQGLRYEDVSPGAVPIQAGLRDLELSLASPIWGSPSARALGDMLAGQASAPAHLLDLVTLPGVTALELKGILWDLAHHRSINPAIDQEQWTLELRFQIATSPDATVRRLALGQIVPSEHPDADSYLETWLGRVASQGMDDLECRTAVGLWLGGPVSELDLLALACWPRQWVSAAGSPFDPTSRHLLNDGGGPVWRRAPGSARLLALRLLLDQDGNDQHLQWIDRQVVWSRVPPALKASLLMRMMRTAEARSVIEMLLGAALSGGTPGEDRGQSPALDAVRNLGYDASPLGREEVENVLFDLLDSMPDETLEIAAETIEYCRRSTRHRPELLDRLARRVQHRRQAW